MTTPPTLKQRVQSLLKVLLVAILPISALSFLSVKTAEAGEFKAPLQFSDGLRNQVVSVGLNHSCGLKENGTIMCWGSNTYGQLDAPYDFYAQVSAGGNHSCGLASDSTIVCWGDNSSGQTSVPAPNTDFTQVSAGENHTCGRKNDGSIVCWGSNSFSKGDIPAPNSNFALVSAGYNHTCALKDDGSILCWGNNANGQSTSPSPNTYFTSVSAGMNHTCGRKSDGSIQCWGSNENNKSTIPGANSDFTQVSAGYYHTCGRKNDGSIVCWGTLNRTYVPSPNSDFRQVSAGAGHSCGLKGDGTIVCWGISNYSGQLGFSPLRGISAGGFHTCGLMWDPSGYYRIVCWGYNFFGQTSVPTISPIFTEVTAGGSHTCGLQWDGDVQCWGGITSGQSTVPTPNFGFSRVSAGNMHTCARGTFPTVTCWGDVVWATDPVPNSDFWVPVAAGGYHSCGIKSDSSITCWGQNTFGQLDVPSPNSNFHDVSAGFQHTCGLKDNGSIVCWGDNSAGQTNVPPSITDFDEVSAGENHTCGRRSDGSIMCWGDNTYGQLDIPAPNASFGEVSAGYHHTCALKYDGTLICWGDNSQGQTIPLSHFAIPYPSFRPIAIDDSYPILEDQQLAPDSTQGLLTNDIDPDGPILLAVKDTDPSNGTLTLSGDGSFTYDPTTNYCGPDSFTYHATDGQRNSDIATVDITITCVNDPPNLTASNPATVNEDAGAQSVNNWAIFSPGPANESSQAVSGYSVSNVSNSALFAFVPAVDTSGNLTYTPAADAFGTSTFDVVVQDDGGTENSGDDTSAPQTFTITVNPINDQPDFSASDPAAVNEDSGPQTVNGWSTFSPGPANESTQSVFGYTVSNVSTPGIFSTPPSVDSSGNLSYTPATNAYGSSTFDVQVQDDGGTVDGGVDTSPTHTFTITINPVNDAPVLDNSGNMSLASIAENDSTNNGSLVSEIINSAGGDRITDIDVGAIEGIAVTGVDNSNGTWQFSTNNGVSWSDLGTPTNTAARTLASDANTHVRFVPNTDWVGTVDPGITFRAWDQTTGMNGDTENASTNGGTTAFSMSTETAAITVAPYPRVSGVVVAAIGTPIYQNGTLMVKVKSISVAFDIAVDDPPGDTDMDDVTNPANYLLIQDGRNRMYDTSSCLGGVAGDDLQITTGPVSYNGTSFRATFTVNSGRPLPNGDYRLFICGTTSITAGGLPLAGNGETGGTDFVLDFNVTVPTELPATGFAPGKETSLPAQPLESSYTDLGTLWLEIPHLNIQASIVGVPAIDGTWDITWLSHQIGWLEGTAFPTWAGNSVLTAHVIEATGLPGPFAYLGGLWYGDKIIVHAWGQEYIYEVRIVWHVAPDAISSVLHHEEYPWLTLLTCRDYNPSDDTYRYRIMVRAVQVKIQ